MLSIGLKLLICYLPDEKQVVKMKDSRKEYIKIDSGITQGTG